LSKSSSSSFSSLPTLSNYQEFVHEKENILLYPTTINDLKGQLLFAEKIDKSLISKHKLTVVFVGNEDTKQRELLTTVMKNKKIPFTITGLISREKLIDYYVKAKCIGKSSFDPLCFAYVTEG